MAWLTFALFQDPEDLRGVKERLALLYIVLNLDKLEPRVEKDSPSLVWHDSEAFKHDWKIGVYAALAVLKDMVRFDLVKGAVVNVEKDLQGIVDRTSVYPTGSLHINLRCICDSPEHSDRHSLVKGSMSPRSQRWPAYIKA